MNHDIAALLRSLPKIDLHRHLEGSVRLETLLDIAKYYKIDLPAYDAEGLRSFVQVTPGSPYNSVTFLSKFNLLRRFYYSQEVIQRITREAIEDAAADNVKYLELRFTPKALSKLMNFSFDEVIRWVCDATAEVQQQFPIQVRLIVSMNRHESAKEGEKMLQMALDYRHRGIVAVDLAGQETGYAAEPFYELFRAAKKAGLGITVHAGEWAGPGNVQTALEEMDADRIGHGVRAIEDHRVVRMAIERGTAFEVCPTSNVQSGAVASAQQHPLRDMTQIGIKTTINTDDPSVSDITLSTELQFCMEQLGLTFEEIKTSILNAANCAFLSSAERAELVSTFSSALTPISLS